MKIQPIRLSELKALQLKLDKQAAEDERDRLLRELPRLRKRYATALICLVILSFGREFLLTSTENNLNDRDALLFVAILVLGGTLLYVFRDAKRTATKSAALARLRPTVVLNKACNGSLTAARNWAPRHRQPWWRHIQPRRLRQCDA